MAYPTSIAFKHIGHAMGLQPIDATSTTQAHPLGMEVQAEDATYGVGTFKYLKGCASTVKGAVVSFDSKTAETVLAVAAGASSTGPVGVAMSDNVASQFGWYQVDGSGLVWSGTVADNGALFLTSTAGKVDDVVLPNERISGMRAKAASSTFVTAWAVDTAVAEGALYSNDSGKVYVARRAGITARAWQASTGYELGTYVTNDTGKLYVCMGTGISNGSGGPTGTNTSGITDNTCTWGYLAAVGGPTGTGSGIRDNGVLWDYYTSAALNVSLTQVSMSRPSIVGEEGGTTQLYRIDLSAAAEDTDAIVVTGTVKTIDGVAIGAAVQVVVKSLAVTDSAGDITVTAGTEKKTVNPATGENVSWIETTAAGGFAVSIANTNAEVTLVSATTSNGLPANLKLTFA